MADLERLVELIGQVQYLGGLELALADHLIAHGVTIPVRCKDCKWFAKNNGGEWYGCSMFNAIRTVPEDAPKENDFCSYGERKDNGQTD